VEAAIALAMLLAASGCAPRQGQGAASHIRAQHKAEDRSSRAEVSTTSPPVLPFKEYALPGSYQVTGYTDKYALLTLETHREYPSAELRLLSLADGRARPLILMPVESGKRFDILGGKLSNEVVAWEEVSPGEADRPGEASWRLYASRYDPARGLTATPTLVDSSDKGRRRRPLFGVDGHAVIWTTNDQRVSGGRVVERLAGRVGTFDVGTGERRQLLADSSGFGTLSVSEHRVLVTRFFSGRHELLTLDLANGRTSRVSLGTGEPSHFPAAGDGWMSWAAFRSGSEWPDLYVRDPGGKASLLGRDSLDAVFAGPYVFFESNEPSSAPRDRSHYGSIWGMRLGTGRKFRLLLTDVSAEGWWQTPLSQGRVEDVFVVFNDLSPWNEGRDARTLVRVYRLSSASSAR
jgi:hypothetical protein